VNQVQVLVSGLAWMGQGIRSIETVLEELLQSAQDEIMITAYAIGNVSDSFFKGLEHTLSRGVRIHLIINHPDKQPDEVLESLRSLSVRYRHFHLYSFEHAGENADLHAKIIVVDRQKALVGSANLSYRGWTTNHELAVLVNGPAAGEIHAAVERLRFSQFCHEIK
jgi:cardiolipin synthase